MECLCVICGENPINFTNDKSERLEEQLLRSLWTALRISEIDNGSFLEGNSSLDCCEKCVDLLTNVNRVHQIILAAEAELKGYLSMVEGLILKSEKENKRSSSWSSRCCELRRHIVGRKVPDHLSVPETGIELGPIIKEEIEIFEDHDNAPFDSVFRDIDWDAEAEPAVERVLEYLPINTDIHDIPVKSEEPEPQRLVPKLPETPRRRGRPRKDTLPSPIKSKKRKVIVISQELSPPPEERRSSSRVAKKSAEKALKYYAASEDEDDPKNKAKSMQDEDDQDYNSAVEISEEESAASDVEDHDNNEEYDDSRKRPSVKAKGRPPKRNRDPNAPRKVIRGDFNPFLMTPVENVYLYKRGTFIRFTYTQLHCEAHNCSFSTDFDYYPSFQRMKQHIEENHRSRKHRQRTQHNCSICNTIHHNQDSLRKHILATHPRFLVKSRAVCECCLAPMRNIYVRTHLFSHKNEEEKAIARAKGDVTKRILMPKESEMDDSQRKHACDFENCTYASKSSKNLKRHKQTHLSKDQRTDHTICPECGHQMLKESLQAHMLRMHHPESVDRVRICPICDKRFLPSDQSNLEKHIRRHRNDRPFLCTECGASFVGSVELNQHMYQVHTTCDPIACEFCDKVFTKPRSLMAHRRRRHRDLVPVGLDKKRSSRFYSQPETDAPVFGPIQQFPCPICEVLCKYRSTLKTHMQRFHDPQGEGRERKRRSKKNEPKVGLDDNDSSSMPENEFPLNQYTYLSTQSELSSSSSQQHSIM